MEIKIHLQGEVGFFTDIGPCSCPSLGQIRNCLIHLAIAMNHKDLSYRVSGMELRCKKL